MHGDAEVGRQCPWSGGPDDHARGPGKVAGDQWEFYEDCRTFLVLILDLRLRQGGLRAVGPLHRLLGLIDRAVLHQFREDPQDARLVGGIHRQVGVLPIAENPEPAEGTALDIDVIQGELGAAAADLRGLEAGGFLHDLELDRQAVAVPARHEGRGETRHGFGFHHQILEQLVERGAHVDVAICERRAVMKNELRGVLRAAAGKNFRVKSPAFPALQTRRFVLHQVPPHRESRLRESQGVFVIRGGAHDGARKLAMGPGGVNHGDGLHQDPAEQGQIHLARETGSLWNAGRYRAARLLTACQQGSAECLSESRQGVSR